PNFFAEFEKRRGYKLQTELPALFGKENNDHANRVKCDYRQTVSEIMAEESLPKWTQWSHEHGFITRNQAHGSPGNWLDLYAAADIPETEMFHTDRNKLISKFASSAAHVTGKPLVSSETGTWLEEHFTEKLSDVKYLMDDMFLSGINHMFYHGCCYSPDEAGWPGWHFYASLEMNPRNSIWHDAPALNAYAARCQAILQSGQPDNDILLYYNTADFWMQPGDKLLPQLTVHARDRFEGQPIGRAAKELWDKGYSFDYVSDAQLKTAKVVKVIHPGGFAPGFGSREGRYGSYTNYTIQTLGAKYQAIFVPECKYIPLETFQQLLSLAETGAMVIFHKQLPTAISGLTDFKGRTDTLHELQGKIQFHGGGEFSYGMISNASYGQGQIIISTLDLGSWGGVGSEGGLAGRGLSYVRRSLDNGWVYFIANRTDQRTEECEVSLGRQGEMAVLLDPMTGKSGLARMSRSASYYSYLPTLAPGESIFLRVFDRNYFKTNKIDNSSLKFWDYENLYHRKLAVAPLEITGPWNVKFILGGPTLPVDFQTAQLASWTTFPDTNMPAFAGTAKYETAFAAPPERGSVTRSNSATSDALRLTEPRSSYSLDLGDVRQSARVRVNGKDYGTLITPPFRVVVDNLKPAGNTLEVEVTSVAANRIRDLDRRGVPWKTFRDINIVNLDYKPFDASHWPLTDCGLLGPVTLYPVTASP
ncbi:MAG: glycosyl hydrolase, partial [Eubacteriales bacterium]